jgi:sulfotransferase
MVKKVMYNSSMPRAGSTLIQNILGQNPDFYVTPTSGVFEMLNNSRAVYTNGQEFKAQDEKLMEEAWKGYCKGAVYGYFNAITDKPYVIDKCRGWGMERNFIDFYEPGPKIITMIRDPRAVYASLEKKYRANPQLDTGVANWGNLTGTTTDKRIIHWSNTVPIGPTMDRLYQVLLEGIHENVLFIKFENLTTNPDKELRRIYEYLELPYYKHDFNNVEQITHEDDKIWGVFGDHVIKNKVAPVKEDFREILGPSGCQLITDNYQWFYEAFEYKI